LKARPRLPSWEGSRSRCRGFSRRRSDCSATRRSGESVDALGTDHIQLAPFKEQASGDSSEGPRISSALRRVAIGCLASRWGNIVCRSVRPRVRTSLRSVFQPLRSCAQLLSIRSRCTGNGGTPLGLRESSTPSMPACSPSRRIIALSCHPNVAVGCQLAHSRVACQRSILACCCPEERHNRNPF
jgi:hypothetical protein